MILVHQRTDIAQLENYRPISLLSHLYKVFIRIVITRLENKIDFYQPVEQADFRREYGTNGHLESIKTLIEKTIEYSTALVLTFVDFQKAFDTIELIEDLRGFRNAVDY
ncbi:hypothetical protein Trydic_g13957 [Trypoxylus dichotomus]